MCTKCYKSYGRGGWTKDGEGNDEYCRCELFFHLCTISHLVEMSADENFQVK